MYYQYDSVNKNVLLQILIALNDSVCNQTRHIDEKNKSNVCQ